MRQMLRPKEKTMRVCTPRREKRICNDWLDAIDSKHRERGIERVRMCIRSM